MLVSQRHLSDHLHCTVQNDSNWNFWAENRIRLLDQSQNLDVFYEGVEDDEASWLYKCCSLLKWKFVAAVVAVLADTIEVLIHVFAVLVAVKLVAAPAMETVQ